MEGEGGAVSPDSICRVRPYDDAKAVRLLTAVEDIIEFDKALRAVTEGLPKPIRLGSVLRAGELAYPQWGIGINDGNREQIRELAGTYYLMDAEVGRSDGGCDPLKCAKKELASDGLESMAAYIARLVTEVAMALDDGVRKFRLCNIASGSGRLCSAIATAMREEQESEGLLRRTEFHLVDYPAKISKAQLNLDGSGAIVVPHPVLDEQFLRSGEGGFDFIVTLAHLHRKPFLGDYLGRLNDALAEGGLLVSGDFHSMLCQHPSMVYNLLSEMSVEGWRLNRLDDLLGPLAIGRPDVLRQGESEAIDEHCAYWHRLSSQMDRHYQGDQRVRIMGAFTSTGQLGEALRSAGFCTDHALIRKAFSKARMPSKFPIRVGDCSDNAAVTVAAKLAKGG
jgi:hypothetical protein